MLIRYPFPPQSYPEKDCNGMPYCMGPVVDAERECADLSKYSQLRILWCVIMLTHSSNSLGKYGKGQSAMVHCDNGSGTEQRDECMSSPLLKYMWGNW